MSDSNAENLISSKLNPITRIAYLKFISKVSNSNCTLQHGERVRRKNLAALNSLWILARISKWSLLPLSSLSNELKIYVFRFFYDIHLVSSSLCVSIAFNIDNVNQSELSIVCVFDWMKLFLFCTLQNNAISFTANFNFIYDAFWMAKGVSRFDNGSISTVNLNSFLRTHRASGGFFN